MEMLAALFLALVQTAPAQLTPVQVGFLWAPGLADGNELGAAVALEGPVLAAGAPGDDTAASEAGAALIFRRTTSAWDYDERVTAWDADGGEAFGSAVALEGGRLAVGAPGESVGGVLTGAVYTFTWSGTDWVPEQKLTAVSASGAPTLGRRVALLGDDLAAVGQSDNGIDAVFVFDRSGGSYAQQAALEPHAGVPGGWSFVSGLSLGSGVLAAGAPSDFDPGFVSTGSASVYRRTGTTWNLEAREYGSQDDWLGWAVALDTGGARLAASALLAEEVRTWSESSGLWSAEPTLPNPVPAGADEFGYALDLEGGLLVVGERRDDTQALDGGLVQVFQDMGAGFTSTGALAYAVAAGDRFGEALDLDGTVLGVGIPGWSQEGAVAVWEFRPPGVGTTYCTAGSSAAGCQALIGALGTPSATAASGFTLLVDSVQTNRDGLFYFGTNGAQAQPWGNSSSFKCVVPPVVRTPKLTGSGPAFTCLSNFALDLNAFWCPTCPKPQKNPGPGAQINVQFWYRDPSNTSNQVSAYSDGLELLVGP